MIWLVSPGAKLFAESIVPGPCPCKAGEESDLVFGEPRYDPDSTVFIKGSARKLTQPRVPKMPLFYNQAEGTEALNEALKLEAENAKQEEQEAAEEVAEDKANDNSAEVKGSMLTQAPPSARPDTSADQPEEAKVEPVQVSAATGETPGTKATSLGGVGPMEVPEQKEIGLLDRCQGYWYHEDGIRIGNVVKDHVIWCDQSFESPPSQLTVTSDTTLDMDLFGESHSATFEILQQHRAQKLVWSDGEVWLQKIDAESSAQ